MNSPTFSHPPFQSLIIGKKKDLFSERLYSVSLKSKGSVPTCQAFDAAAITACDIIKALPSEFLPLPVSQFVTDGQNCFQSGPIGHSSTPREMKWLGKKKATVGRDTSLRTCIPRLQVPSANPPKVGGAQGVFRRLGKGLVAAASGLALRLPSPPLPQRSA